MPDNHEDVSVEVTGQQQSVTVGQEGQGGSGTIDVSAAARDVSLIDIPVATRESLGGVIVGDGLIIENGLLGIDFPNENSKFLRGDNSWETPEDPTVEIITSDSESSLPLIVADHSALWTGRKTRAVVMYTSHMRPRVHMMTGVVSATGFAGKGDGLSNLNASELKSGTVPPDRLPLASQYERGAMSPQDKQLLQNLLQRVEALEAQLSGG